MSVSSELGAVLPSSVCELATCFGAVAMCETVCVYAGVCVCGCVGHSAALGSQLHRMRKKKRKRG